MRLSFRDKLEKRPAAHQGPQDENGGFLLFFGLCALVMALGYLDTVTGYEISFSIFYFLPILIAARWLGLIAVNFISFFSAAIWLFADLYSGHQYSHYLIPIWNAGMRLGFFLMISFFARGFWRELRIEKDLARKDSLTQVLNARYFSELIEIEINRSLRFKRPMALVYIDVDNFKRVNDSFGHGQGDLLLRVMAQTIRENLRKYDLAARLGGDEFAIFLPETNDVQAKSVVKKIERQLLSKVKPMADFITFSFGVAVFTSPVFSVQEMIKKADSLMYKIKNTTKNGSSIETF